MYNTLSRFPAINLFNSMLRSCYWKNGLLENVSIDIVGGQHKVLELKFENTRTDNATFRNLSLKKLGLDLTGLRRGLELRDNVKQASAAGDAP